MYCPKCKRKYLEELLVCEECNISLIPAPPLQRQDFSNFSRLHSPSSSSELLMIKSILSRADINYYTTNDKNSPDIELHKGCMVMVQDGHLKRARQILSDYQVYIKNHSIHYSNKGAAFDNPRKTLKNFLFGWAKPGKKKE